MSILVHWKQNYHVAENNIVTIDAINIVNSYDGNNLTNIYVSFKEKQ